MEKENLKLGTKDAQLQLLQQVLNASDADAEEEEVKEETFDGLREAKVGVCSCRDCRLVCAIFLPL